jgi:hypothetical protein
MNDKDEILRWLNLPSHEALENPILLMERLFNGWRIDSGAEQRFRRKWDSRLVMDITPRGGSHELEDWVIANIRASIIPEQEVGVFFPTVEAAVSGFWRFYDEFKGRDLFQFLTACSEPKPDKPMSGQVRFKSGGGIRVVTASDLGRGECSPTCRYNTVLIADCERLDAVGPGDLVDREILPRVTRPSWNPEDPILCNRVLMRAFPPNPERWGRLVRMRKMRSSQPLDRTAIFLPEQPGMSG